MEPEIWNDIFVQFPVAAAVLLGVWIVAKQIGQRLERAIRGLAEKFSEAISLVHRRIDEAFKDRR